MEGQSIEDMTAYAIGKLRGGWSQEQVAASIREMLAAEGWPEPAIEAMLAQVAAQVREQAKTEVSASRETSGQEERASEQPDTTRVMMRMMQQMMSRMDTLEKQKAGSTTPPEPTAALPTLTARKRYPDPEIFDGTRSKYQGWKYNCQAKLTGDGFLYQEDIERNQYIFSRTKDRANSTLLPWLRVNERGQTAALWAFMDIEFGDQYEEESAIDKLQSIKQNKDSLRVYRQRFNELLLRSGEHVSDRLKRTWFLRGLNSTTYSQMSSISPTLGFTQFTDEAIRLADFHYRGQFTNQAPVRTNAESNARAGYSYQKRAASPERMDWQPTISNQGGSQKRQAKWVTRAEIQRRQDNGLCIRCGAGNHYVQQCPYLPARHPSPIRAAKTMAQPLLEELLPIEPQSENE